MSWHIYGKLPSMTPGTSFARLWFTRVLAFIRLGRFPFLVGGFILYGLGAVVATYQGAQINWLVYGWGQLVVTATQLMVHYANDYYDMAADRMNHASTMWSGGSRVLIEGHLSPRVAQTTANCFALVALIGAALLVAAEHSLVIFVFLFTAIGLSWFYSAPPLRLHSRSVGELSATLVVAFLTPLTAYYLQAERLALLPVLASIPISLLQFNMLVSVAMPDMEGDALANKRTLVVRLGRASAARIYLVMLILAYGLLPMLVLAGLPAFVAGAFSLSLILAAPLGWWLWRGAWTRPRVGGWVALLSIALLLGASVLEVIGFVLLTVAR